jgi:hydrogenase maturation protease HycI
MPFEEDLLGFLTGSRGLLLVGIGNTARRDDSAGVRVITRLRGRVPEGVVLLDTGTTPENYSSKIKQLKPRRIIFFDAVEMGMDAGTYCFIDEETLVSQTVSTHKQPLSMLMRILREGLHGTSIRLVGIQPKTTDFGFRMSVPVNRGVNALVSDILKAMGGSRN